MLDMQESSSQSIESRDPVAQIRLGIAGLAAEDWDSWIGVAKSQRVQELLEVRERLDAELLRAIGSWDRDRAWEIDGSLSPRAWLTHRTPVTDGEAQRLVKNARLVSENPEISTALAEGELTVPHVGAIGWVVSKDRAPLLSDHVAVLVDQGTKLPLADFTTVMRRWASLADDQIAKQDFTQKWERRHLHASTTLDGWVAGDFYLDPVAGSQMLNVLDHIAPPDPEGAPDGPRMLSQRRADALADLTNWYLNKGEPGGNPPYINVAIDVASLTGETPQLAAARCDIDGIAQSSTAYWTSSAVTPASAGSSQPVRPSSWTWADPPESRPKPSAEP